MTRHALFSLAFIAVVSSASAQSISIGPAPSGNAITVASQVIKQAEHPCPKVTGARRLKDGSITAKCSNAETYRVFSVKDKPVALRCSVAKAIGVSGC